MICAARCRRIAGCSAPEDLIEGVKNENIESGGKSVHGGDKSRSSTLRESSHGAGKPGRDRQWRRWCRRKRARKAAARTPGAISERDDKNWMKHTLWFKEGTGWTTGRCT